VIAGLWAMVVQNRTGHWQPMFDHSPASDTNALSQGRNFLYATALMFVAYTGYGRIATLGEEVHNPRKTIPRAIIITLIVSAVLYISVGAVSIALVGSEALGNAAVATAAPLELVANETGLVMLPVLVSMGAMTAM